MFEIQGLHGESIVVDGTWVEKLRAGSSVARKPASSYRDITVDEVTRRRFIVFGERERMLSVTVAMDTFLGLVVRVAQRDEVGRLRDALEAARDDAGS